MKFDLFMSLIKLLDTSGSNDGNVITIDSEVGGPMPQTREHILLSTISNGDIIIISIIAALAIAVIVALVLIKNKKKKVS